MDYTQDLFTRPGFFHIARNILNHVDFWTLMKIRKVCKSWKTLVDSNEMSDKICFELSTKCLNQLKPRSPFQEDRPMFWKKVLDDLMKSNDKECFKQFTTIMRDYWTYQKTEDYVKTCMDPYEFCLDKKIERDISFLWKILDKEDKESYLVETCEYANENGNLPITILIIEWDEDKNPILNPQLQTFLHQASEYGNIPIVEHILEKIEEDSRLNNENSERLSERQNPKNKWHVTPVHLGKYTPT